MNNPEFLALKTDTLKFIKENYSLTDTFLVKEENVLFFSSAKKMETPLVINVKKGNIEVSVKPAQIPVQKAKTFKEEKKSEMPAALPFDHIRKLIEKVHPHLTLTNQIPDDAIARKKAEIWKEQEGSAAQIAILYFGESPQDLEFLKKLAKALHTSFSPTKLIDAKRLSEEKKWDTFLKEGKFKLILSPEKGLQNSFELMRLYTEIPKTGHRFLGKTPLLLLSASDHYLKNPHLKRTLWSTLCQILKA